MIIRIKNETNLKNPLIKKLSKTKYRVLLGPFSDIKKLEQSFDEIKLLEFENLEMELTNMDLKYKDQQRKKV